MHEGGIFCMDVIGLHKTSCAIPAYMYIVIDIFSGFSFCFLFSALLYQRYKPVVYQGFFQH
jgi:hypothetical protein